MEWPIKLLNSLSTNDSRTKQIDLDLKDVCKKCGNSDKLLKFRLFPNLL